MVFVICCMQCCMCLSAMGPDLTFGRQVGHADPLDGYHCLLIKAGDVECDNVVVVDPHVHACLEVSFHTVGESVQVSSLAFKCPIVSVC